MKALIAGLFLASTFANGTAMAQPAPFNEVGVTWGHWHIISKDVEANKKLFLGMGGKLFMPGGAPVMMFPGVYINLNLGTEKGEGGTGDDQEHGQGNHKLQERKASGGLPG